MLIGISGKKGSGKDTMAEAIKTTLINNGFSVKTIGFADALKQWTAQMFGIGENAFYDVKRKDDPSNVTIDNKVLSNRNLLQKFGEGVRLLDSEIWIKQVFKEKKNYDFLIITDVRYQNELDILEKNDGLLVRINRTNRNVDNPNDTHSSETDLDNIHFANMFQNDGTMEELKEYANGIAEKACTIRESQEQNSCS